MLQISKCGIAVMVWALIAEAAAQQEPLDKVRAATNNLGHELVVCTAFFYVTAIGMLNRGDDKGREMASRQRQIGDRLAEVAGDLGRIIGQKPEAIAARLEMALAGLRKEMDDNFVNYSILQLKYMQPCADLAANVTARIAALKNAGQ
jgi:hypothetical protein